MQIAKLDHVNIRTNQLEVLTKWYTDLLGLRNGPRPDFPFPGAWLFAGDTAVVHLVAVDGAPGAGSETDLKLEHFSFTASGAAAFESRLKAAGETYKRVDVSATNMIAFNIWDPDGNHIHVDFPTSEITA